MDWKDGNVTTATILSENGGEAVVQTKNASLATVVDSDGNVVDVTPVKKTVSLSRQKPERAIH